MFWTWAAAPQPSPWTNLPLGLTWPTAITAVISLIALGLSIATFVQRYRLNPQPKLVPDWG